jgi:hypothetical protein
LTQSFVRWSKLSLGSLLVGCVLLLNVLAASPNLHQLVHADAGQPEHQCAVTFFTHGQMEASVAVVAAAVPVAPFEFLPHTSVSFLDTLVATLPPGRAPPVSISSPV